MRLLDRLCEFSFGEFHCFGLTENFCYERNFQFFFSLSVHNILITCINYEISPIASFIGLIYELLYLFED